jgi:hypothetical protein
MILKSIYTEEGRLMTETFGKYALKFVCSQTCPWGDLY